MVIEAALFDLDGTLADTAPDLGGAPIKEWGADAIIDRPVYVFGLLDGAW